MRFTTRCSGRVVASVRTAVPLDDALRSQISDQLGSLMQKQVRLRESVDPDLIGGMVIRVGDKVYDSSVANRLNKMARRTRDGFSSQLLHQFTSIHFGIGLIDARPMPGWITIENRHVTARPTPFHS